MATYLVTGGLGFIGSHIVELLLTKGHSVKILDNLSSGKRDNVSDKAEVLIGDIRNPNDVRKAMKNTDGCFHFAAVASVEKSTTDWVDTHQSNLTGTIVILDQASKLDNGPIPIVYASSAAVYGLNTNLPLSETSDLGPISAYGADKLGCELHAKIAGTIHGVPTLGLRMFNVYGPRQDPKSPYSGAVSIFLHLAENNKDLTIFGSGDQTRDFIYVGDVAEIAYKALDKATQEGEILNLCSGQSRSIKELASLLIEKLGSDSTIKHLEKRTGDILHSAGKNEKVRKLVEHQEFINLEEGLVKLIKASN